MKKKQRDDGETPQEEGPVETSGESFGTWLRRQREGREIDLREIAEASKIGLRYLQAFEEDQFEILPAQIFAKGFLRQYARYVGLDPEEVVNFYLSACQNAEDDESALGPVQTSDRRPHSAWLLFIGAAVFIVLFWWLLHQKEQTAVKDQVKPPSSVEVPAVDEAPKPTPTPPQVEEESAEPEASPVVDDEKQSAVRVILDFSGDCWIEASTDGVKRLSETKVQGESMVLDAEQSVELKIGDVEAVQVSVNDQPFPLIPKRGSTVLDVMIDLEMIANLEGGPGGPEPTE